MVLTTISAMCSTVSTPFSIVGLSPLHTAIRKSWSRPVMRPMLLTAHPCPWKRTGVQPFFSAT